MFQEPRMKQVPLNISLIWKRQGDPMGSLKKTSHWVETSKAPLPHIWLVFQARDAGAVEADRGGSSLRGAGRPWQALQPAGKSLFQPIML